MGNKEVRTSPFKAFAIIFLIILIVSMLFVTAVHIVFKNKNVTPSVGGYSLYLIQDDYMSPNIEKNTLILATNGTPIKEDIGKVIIADDVSGANGITYGTTAMRLVDLVVENEELYYEIKFDISDETTMVKGDKIVGIANYQFDWTGKIIVLAKSIIGSAIFVGVPLILMIIFFALNGRSKRKQLAVIEQKRVENYSKPIEPEEDNTQPSLDDFIKEKDRLNNDNSVDNPIGHFSDGKGSEILNEPLIEEGVNKDDLVEMKEDLTRPTNNVIEELMKILEEENAKLKELELPKAEKEAQEFQEKAQDDLDDTPTE